MRAGLGWLIFAPVLPLLAVPNVSEGRDGATIEAIGEGFVAGGRAKLLDVHSDESHHRSVFTLAGAQGELAAAVLGGAKVAVERIDVVGGPRGSERGEHPHVGALDVAPIVYLDPAQRGAACAEALVLAHEIGEMGVPVLLYGELARGRTRAQLRRGGVAGLGERMRRGELAPDFGPAELHPKAGATLVAAREPLVAFNIELAAPATAKDARRIAGLIREGGEEGLEGVRAIGVALREGVRGGVEREAVAQVSTNVERPLELSLARVVEAVRRHAPVACAEIVGLVPKAALDGFPQDVPLLGFDAGARTLENALGF